ncbi:MAG: sortase [Lachnospiraceae bacterium]|nr:sortase [Lachnospiraceae bacterium]
MKKTIGIICIIAGIAMVFLSIYLIGKNYYVEYNAGKSIDNVIPKLEEKIGSADVGTDTLADVEETIVDGHVYIGILKVPSQNLELPIIKEWNYDNLEIAPCRFTGSYKSKDLVIAGHNYKRHFSKLKNLQKGDEIIFVAANGKDYIYRVSLVEVLEPKQVEYLINKEKENEWDLSLFTCTKSGAGRYVVRCIETNSVE